MVVSGYYDSEKSFKVCKSSPLKKFVDMFVSCDLLSFLLIILCRNIEGDTGNCRIRGANEESTYVPEL